ncbi:MAG: helix-turn-helix transcriptional regulator [Bacteroides sp.]|nr:helix-turn-helix transcriptional regulator [Bacteroides sp.]
MKDLIKIDLNNPKIQEVNFYNNGKLALFSRLKSTNPQETVQIEAYLIMLCLQGRASLNINGTPYIISTNDIFISLPNSVICDYRPNNDFRCNCIGMSPAYIQRILPIANNTWDVRILFDKKPICRLKAKEVDTFNEYYNLLRAKATHSTTTQNSVIDALMQAFIYDMQNFTDRLYVSSTRPFNSGEILFKRLVALLESTYPKNRTVAYYADRLYVSPKYLSSVCKKVSGQNISNIIDQYVLKDVEQLMKYSDKSIKEIADELEFSNLSFFGKYVKRHLGMSPKKLRDSFR